MRCSLEARLHLPGLKVHQTWPEHTWIPHLRRDSNPRSQGLHPMQRGWGDANPSSSALNVITLLPEEGLSASVVLCSSSSDAVPYL